MARSSSSPIARTPENSSGILKAQETSNELLLALPRKEYDTLLPELDFVILETHVVLNEMGESIDHCYFVNSGLVSIVNVMGDGKSVEVGVTGKEGFIGLPLVVGLKTSSTRAVMQVAGTAFRLDSSAMERLLPKCPQLEKLLNRFSQVLGLQATQVAACNRLHEVDERLARWLLMSQDRLGGEVVPLTQEFLAHMLGTRRASVTVAAGNLQKQGLIQYTRGAVTIADRAKLESAACECYGMIVRQSGNWRQEASR